MTEESQNALLHALAPADYSLLRPHLTRVNMVQHDVLQRPNEPIENIYFPLEGMISLVANFPSGEEIEIAAIGKEGAIGMKLGLLPQLAFALAIVQLPGIALRIPLKRFQEIAKGNDAITHIATCANDVMIANLQQAAACNATHNAEARFARWLLHARDRYTSNMLPLTQEFMAQMLGVRRTTVTLVASELEKRGFVKYSRGKIQILDQDGLRQLACSCYRIMQTNIDLIGEAAKRARGADR